MMRETLGRGHSNASRGSVSAFSFRPDLFLHKADGVERRGLRVQCRKVFGGKLDKLGRMLATVQWPPSDDSVIVFKWSFRPRAREIAHYSRKVGVP